MPSTQAETTAESSGAYKWLAIAARSPLLLIAALFFSQLAALWTYRLDYPINDDWRYYRLGTRLPDELTLEWLFLPARDTLHISGKLADWLFFRFVAHDYHDIAATSFVLCFGGWLICALALCVVLTRRRRSMAFASLLVFALPLAAMPYWVTASGSLAAQT